MRYLILAMLLIGCATFKPAPRSCEDVHKEIAAKHIEAGHRGLEAGRTEDGYMIFVWADKDMKVAHIDAYRPDNVKNNLPAVYEEVDTCVDPTNNRLMHLYQGQLPIKDESGI